MKYTPLKNATDHISIIGLGTMTFGQQNTLSEAMKQMDYAVDHGINFFDTAEMYPVPANPTTQGATESYIGEWLVKSKKRPDIMLATKITGIGKHVSHVAPSLRYTKERLKDALRQSLIRLKTDYIDIYQLHWPERSTNCFGKLGYPVDNPIEWEDNFKEVVHTLSQFRREGYIRYWGLSNETPWGLMRALQESSEFENFSPVTIQNPYNLLNRTFEIGLSEMAMREQVGLLAYSPLAFGLLTGKYHDKTATNFSRLKQFPQMARYNSPIVYSIAEEYIQLARQYDLSPVQLALGYILNRPFLSSVIIGATNLSQLAENLDTSHVQLPAEVLQQVETIHLRNSNPAP